MMPLEISVIAGWRHSHDMLHVTKAYVKVVKNIRLSDRHAGHLLLRHYYV